MCTLTWWQGDSRYALFFNRDELKSRPPAEPPRVATEGGVRFLAPVDGKRGGTWILVNEFGLTLALLNYYDAGIDPESLPADSPSRGRLVMALAPARDPDEAGAALARIPLADYWPFHLFAIAPGAAPLLWTWSGPGSTLLVHPDPRPPVTTSSHRTAEVRGRRIARFREMSTGPDTLARLRDYHHLVDAGDGAFSVRMRRCDAQTVSFSRIEVGASSARFEYRPESLDSLEFNEVASATLPLRAAS